MTHPITAKDLTTGKLQELIESQSPPTTPEQVKAIKQAKRLIRLSKEEENE